MQELYGGMQQPPEIWGQSRERGDTQTSISSDSPTPFHCLSMDKLIGNQPAGESG